MTADRAVAAKNDADRALSAMVGFAERSAKHLMATCPRCMGPLTEDHRCPRGRFSRVTDALTTVTIGGLLGALLVFAVEENPAGSLVLAASALGGVLANAVRQALGPRV
jgi:hypothetical protein